MNSAREFPQTDEPRADDWPADAAHQSARDLVDHVAHGRLTKPARTEVRKALDQAEAPATGRAAQDHALGRAIR